MEKNRWPATGDRLPAEEGIPGRQERYSGCLPGSDRFQSGRPSTRLAMMFIWTSLVPP